MRVEALKDTPLLRASQIARLMKMITTSMSCHQKMNNGKVEMHLRRSWRHKLRPLAKKQLLNLEQASRRPQASSHRSSWTHRKFITKANFCTRPRSLRIKDSTNGPMPTTERLSRSSGFPSSSTLSSTECATAISWAKRDSSCSFKRRNSKSTPSLPPSSPCSSVNAC